MKPCNQNICDLLEYTRKLLFLADKGDLQRDDDGCGVLFGIVRDSAYKMKAMAEAERGRHIANGKWDAEREND